MMNQGRKKFMTAVLALMLSVTLYQGTVLASDDLSGRFTTFADELVAQMFPEIEKAIDEQKAKSVANIQSYVEKAFGTIETKVNGFIKESENRAVKRVKDYEAAKKAEVDQYIANALNAKQQEIKEKEDAKVEAAKAEIDAAMEQKIAEETGGQ